MVIKHGKRVDGWIVEENDLFEISLVWKMASLKINVYAMPEQVLVGAGWLWCIEERLAALVSFASLACCTCF